MPQGVDRLMRGNRVQPGPGRPTQFILGNLEKHLKEGILDDVFGQGMIAEIAAQIAEKLSLITANQRPKRLPLTTLK